MYCLSSMQIPAVTLAPFDRSGQTGTLSCSAVRTKHMNEKLRMARIQKHLSEADVCSAIGADLKTYQNWELGKHTPQPYFRKRLCELFGMSLGELGYDPAA